MSLSAELVPLDRIQPWRDLYRLEMNCQIIHDSIHVRPGWTQEYLLHIDGLPVGYGSIAIAGPWRDKPTIYEFFVAPPYRQRMFDLFSTLLKTSGSNLIETQSNDVFLTTMLHTFAPTVASESILYHDKFTTCHSVPGVTFRIATTADGLDVSPEQLRWHGVVEVEGKPAGSGGILFHYNRPYGDIYMEVREPFRRRGLGSFLVQELKRVCYEGGNVPAARCNPKNIASRRTLQKAGFVPCGHILNGTIAS